MQYKTALVVMARYPEAGKTKTRLARTLGDEPTAQIYRAFLTDLAQRFADAEYALHWAYTPTHVDFAAFLTTLAPSQTPSMCCMPQQGTDFNERLHHVFKWTHARGYQQTIVISSDSPHISRESIARAAQALEQTDVVLGPAEDGGYYLLGMCKPHDVFSGIPMSTEVVLKLTIAAAQRRGLRVQLIESLFDVDELPDLLRLAQLLTYDRALAPATAACLEHLGNPVELSSVLRSRG